jgi:Fe-S-cluster containining protein
MELKNLTFAASKAQKDTRKLFAVLKKKRPDKLDLIFEQQHEAVFAKTDCLSCANCCKTTSPVFTDRDIERLSKLFRIKPSAFVANYLHIDAENDYVLNAAPCPFLGADNYCQVYEDRPKACREYPHTNRKKIYQLLDLTLKNTSICPAAYEIVEGVKLKFSLK